MRRIVMNADLLPFEAEVLCRQVVDHHHHSPANSTPVINTLACRGQQTETVCPHRHHVHAALPAHRQHPGAHPRLCYPEPAWEHNSKLPETVGQYRGKPVEE